MLKIRNMRVEEVETVARMVALDHDDDLEKGYREAREHTLDHLNIVPQGSVKSSSDFYPCKNSSDIFLLFIFAVVKTVAVH